MFAVGKKCCIQGPPARSIGRGHSVVTNRTANLAHTKIVVYDQTIIKVRLGERLPCFDAGGAAQQTLILKKGRCHLDSRVVALQH